MTLKPTEGFVLPYSSKHERIEGENIANKGPNVIPIFVRQWKKLAFCTTLALSLWYFYLFTYKSTLGGDVSFGSEMNATNKHGKIHGTDTSINSTIYLSSTVVIAVPTSTVGPLSNSATNAFPTSATDAFPTNTTDVLPAGATEAIHPNGFESDPDPSTTTYCTVPYDLKKPIVQFTVVLYIGLDYPPRSYIYKFNNCKAFPALEYVRVGQGYVPFKHYAGLGLETAATTLTPHLNDAMHTIPLELHHRTLLSVKLDSALRKDKVLSLWKDSEVLGVIAHRVQHLFRFHTVRYMEDKDALGYAWIVANYEKIIMPDSNDTAIDNFAVVGLGEPVTDEKSQIVFKPDFGTALPLIEKYNVDLGGTTHVLYQHTHRNHGYITLYEAVQRRIISESTNIVKNHVDGIRIIRSPCVAHGANTTLEFPVYREVDVPPSESVIMDGGDIGDFGACFDVVQQVLDTNSNCYTQPCAYGVYQPSISESFSGGKLKLLSHGISILELLVQDSMFPFTAPTPPIKVSTISSIARKVCGGATEWSSSWSNKRVLEFLEEQPGLCVDLTTTYALVRGYGFDDEHTVVLGPYVNRPPLLGVAIEMLVGNLGRQLLRY